MAKRGKLQGLEIAGDVTRPLRIRKYKYLYLIVCEDQKTERVYFQGFEVRIPKDTIFLQAVGTGLDPLGIVNRAMTEKERLQQLRGRSVDVVWVVFDKDDADLNEARIARFEEAFELSKKEGFRVAYSNEAFELWLLLHLIDINPNSTLGRKDIYAKLQQEIRLREGYENFVYTHGEDAILEVIAKIGDEQAALQRADRLILHHLGKSPITSNPVTFVGKLILDLYSWIAYFSFEK